MMRRILSLVSAAMLLSACATHVPKPAVCDGKHRRPVNVYPSVLGGASAPAPDTPAIPPSPPQTPKPHAQVEQRPRVWGDVAAYPSC